MRAGALGASACFAVQPADQPDEQEHAQGDQQKIDHRREKRAVVQGGYARILGGLQGGVGVAIQSDKQVVEVDLTGDQADDGHKQIVDQEVTMLPNAPPMMTPTAMSMTLPFKAKALKSLIKVDLLCALMTNSPF